MAALQRIKSGVSDSCVDLAGRLIQMRSDRVAGWQTCRAIEEGVRPTAASIRVRITSPPIARERDISRRTGDSDGAKARTHLGKTRKHLSSTQSIS